MIFTNLVNVDNSSSCIRESLLIPDFFQRQIPGLAHGLDPVLGECIPQNPLEFHVDFFRPLAICPQIERVAVPDDNVARIGQKLLELGNALGQGMDLYYAVDKEEPILGGGIWTQSCHRIITQTCK